MARQWLFLIVESPHIRVRGFAWTRAEGGEMVADSTTFETFVTFMTLGPRSVDARQITLSPKSSGRYWRSPPGAA